jgi:hypothetical protein
MSLKEGILAFNDILTYEEFREEIKKELDTKYFVRMKKELQII